MRRSCLLYTSIAGSGYNHWWAAILLLLNAGTGALMGSSVCAGKSGRMICMTVSYTHLVTATRMCVGLQLNGNTDDYTIEQGESAVLKHAYELWTKYEDTGSASDYASLLNSDDSQTWSAMQTTVRDYMSQNLPQVIRGEKTWDEYVAGMEANDPSSVCELLQKQIDNCLLYTSRCV